MGRLRLNGQVQQFKIPWWMVQLSTGNLKKRFTDMTDEEVNGMSLQA